MCKESAFNFERERIIQHCEELATLNEQIEYLRWVLLEYKTNPPDLDVNYRIKPTLISFLQDHIEYREYLLNQPESRSAGLVKIRGKVVNIVRIFEGMKNAGIISPLTGIKQIGRIFFSEMLDIKKFDENYRKRKNDTLDQERTTTDKLLVNFVKDLISTSFRGRDSILNELHDHISKVRYK